MLFLYRQGRECTGTLSADIFVMAILIDRIELWLDESVSGVPPDVPLLEMLMLLRYKQQQIDICYTCMPLQKSVLLFMCLSKYTLIPVTVNRYENQ
jgi:hypothetical protein